MKKILLFLSVIFFIASDLKSQQPFKKLKDVSDFVTDSVKKRPDKITANTLNKVFQGVLSWTPDIVQDTASVTSPQHGFVRYQRKDSAVYVYDTIGFKRWRPITATTSGGGTTATVKAFSNINALKLSSFYSTSGDLVADIVDGGRRFKWNGSSHATDDNGVTTVQVTGVTDGRWERVFKGVVRADEVGVKTDGTDQLSLLTTVFNNASVKAVKFDAGDVTFSGKLTVPSGKQLIFENDSKLKGDGGANDTLSGGIIVCDIMKQCLDTSITPLNLENSTMEVRWLGADGRKSLKDNWSIFNKAQSALKQFTNLSSFYNFSGKIHIPRDDSSYYFSKPFILKTSCEFYGDGEIQTMLEFPADSAGITLAYSDGTARAGYFQEFHDLHIRGNGSTYKPNAIGLTVNNFSRIKNVSIDYFGGDGFYFYGSVPNTNCNNAHAELITAQNNRGNGVVAKGSDANVIVFDHINVGANWQYGAVDSSFLGCTWIQPHAEDNGYVSAYSRVRLTDATHTTGSWWVKRTPPVGMKPGVTSGWQQYFHPADTTAWPYSYFPIWDTTVQYLGNGAYASTDNNSRSAWFSPYVEGNQGGALFSGTSTIVYGGLLACDDYTASDIGGSVYQCIKASGTVRPGILVPNIRTIANNGWNTNHSKTYGGIEMRGNESSSYGFNMGGVFPGLNNEHIFGGVGANEQAFTITSINSTATYGRLSALPVYSAIFHNGFNLANANAPDTYTMRIRAASDLSQMGSNNANGDFTFSNNVSGLPGLLGWVNSAQGAGSWDSAYVNGFLPMYTTAARPSTTRPRIIYNVTTGTYQTYTPGTGWANIGSGGGGTPGGSDTYLQFNNAGAFGGSADLVWDNTNKKLTINQQTAAGAVNIKTASGGIGMFIRNTTDADIAFLINSASANEHIFYGNGDAAIAADGKLSIGAVVGAVASQKMYVRGTTGSPNAALFRGLADTDVGFAVSGSTGTHHLFYSNGDVKIADNGGVVTVGAKISYKANYGASFDTRSLVDKGYVDSADAAHSGSNSAIINSGTVTSNDDTLAIPVAADTIGIKVIPKLDYGSYTPTASNTSNVASNTRYSSTMYTRVGSVVTVSGKITITPTASGQTSMDISLPIATANFTDDSQAAGVGHYINGSSQAGLRISANASGQTVKLTYVAPDTAVANFFFTFQYTIQ